MRAASILRDLAEFRYFYRLLRTFMTYLTESHQFDVVIIGAGAAGLFCAGVAGQAGLKVLVIDHSEKVAEKIRISGGGRANFTNKDVSPANFLSENPHFCRSALSRYTPRDFIALMDKHGIAHHEKHKGQLFCDYSAQDLIDMLLKECDVGGVQRWQPCQVQSIRNMGAETASKASNLDNLTAVEHKNEASRRIHCLNSYQINSNKGIIQTANIVIATGGLSIPKIGATDFGYRIAKQFNLRMVEPRPALVPMTFDGDAWLPYANMAGLALPVVIETGTKKSKPNEKASFSEDLLFTHKGLSGPAVLQISSFWREKGTIRLNLAPNTDILALLQQSKARSHKLVANELANLAPNVPSRLAEAWTSTDAALQRPMSDVPDKALTQLAQRLSNWELTPTGTEGYKKAEVTLGGVDTRDVSSQTMESKQSGLYFIGEVLDVTGWLGGYNFQWAWASGFACAQGLKAKFRENTKP
jgi:predicted Rossmann fold flavoprotein